MSMVVLSVFGAIVFAVRLAKRKASRGECLLMGFLLLHMALIQLQIYLDIHAWAFDFRYQAPSFPLLYGWAAYPLVLLCRRYKRLTIVVILILAIVLFRTHRSSKACRKARRDSLALYEVAAEAIRNDWRGPSVDVRTVDDHEYRPAKRPSVAAPPAVAYLAGGRQIWGEWKGWWRHPVDEWNERPDYIFISVFHELDPDFIEAVRACESDRYDFVTAVTARGICGRLFRRHDLTEEWKAE